MSIYLINARQAATAFQYLQLLIEIICKVEEMRGDILCNFQSQIREAHIPIHVRLNIMHCTRYDWFDKWTVLWDVLFFIFHIHRFINSSHSIAIMYLPLWILSIKQIQILMIWNNDGWNKCTATVPHLNQVNSIDIYGKKVYIHSIVTTI